MTRKRQFECSVYEVSWSVLTHGVGHEYVFQRGTAVKWWSAENVCHLCLMLEGHPQERALLKCFGISCFCCVHPCLVQSTSSVMKLEFEKAVILMGWKE